MPAPPSASLRCRQMPRSRSREYSRYPEGIMRAPDWLTARPVAHRGLHDISRGVVENMPGAAQAAIAGNFAIECDIQLTSDGEAMVFHDDELGRLTEGSGALLGKTAAELLGVRFKNTDERMMTLSDLCNLVAGRVPL